MDLLDEIDDGFVIEILARIGTDVFTEIEPEWSQFLIEGCLGCGIAVFDCLHQIRPVGRKGVGCLRIVHDERSLDGPR